MDVKNPVPFLHKFSLLRWRWGAGAAWRINYKQYHDRDIKIIVDHSEGRLQGVEWEAAFELHFGGR